MNTSELRQIFDDVLSPAGFRRRKDTWYKANEDTITLIDLQKSRWGGQYYVNLGVYIRELGEATSPAEHQCHIRTRLPALLGDDATMLDQVLDLEHSGLSARNRSEMLKQALSGIAIPFLTERSVIPRLRELARGNQLASGFVSKAAREFLRGSAQ